MYQPFGRQMSVLALFGKGKWTVGQVGGFQFAGDIVEGVRFVFIAGEGDYISLHRVGALLCPGRGGGGVVVVGAVGIHIHAGIGGHLHQSLQNELFCGDEFQRGGDSHCPGIGHEFLFHTRPGGFLEMQLFVAQN